MFVPEEQTPGPSPTLTSAAATGIDPVGLGGITRLYSLGPVGPILDRRFLRFLPRMLILCFFGHNTVSPCQYQRPLYHDNSNYRDHGR